MLENVFFGSILTITDFDLLVLALSCTLIVVVFIPTFNRILLTSISLDIAKVRGYATHFYDYLFVIMITLVTIAAVKIVGTVLVGTLLLNPGATARLLTKSMGSFVLLSSLLATLSCLIATMLPMELKLPIPSGASIILVAACFFLIATTYRIIRKG